jgi:hypothetical protein
LRHEPGAEQEPGSSLLLDIGVEHTKSRLLKVGYFRRLIGDQQRDRRQHPAAAPDQDLIEYASIAFGSV